MEALTDDDVHTIASFLSVPDLVNLGRTCKRFGGKPGENGDDTGGNNTITKRATKKRKGSRKRKKIDNIDKTAAPVSLINGFARGVVLNVNEVYWRHLLVKKHNESWLAVYHRLLQLQTSSLVFLNFFGNGLQYVDNDLSCVKAKVKSRLAAPGYPSTIATATCQEVMRSGKHYATFTVVWPGNGIEIGIMRPRRHQPTRFSPYRRGIGYWRDQYGSDIIDCCMLCFNIRDENWFTLHSIRTNLDSGTNLTQNPPNTPQGVELEEGKKIILFLDLEEGEFKVFEDRNVEGTGWFVRQIGETITGLSGEFCWAAYLQAGTRYNRKDGHHVWNETCLRVERGNHYPCQSDAVSAAAAYGILQEIGGS